MGAWSFAFTNRPCHVAIPECSGIAHMTHGRHPSALRRRNLKGDGHSSAGFRTKKGTQKMRYKTWMAKRTMNPRLARRLIEAFRRLRREHAYRENQDGSVTLWFRMTVVS